MLAEKCLAQALSSPLIDGGKATEILSAGATLCSNVPRTFLNEDLCVLAEDACRPSVVTDTDILLDNSTIIALYNLTGQYVYGIKGVNVVDQYEEVYDNAWKLPHPCTPSLRSRWEATSVLGCNATNLSSSTNETLTGLLSDESDENPYIKDIYFPETGSLCNASDTNPEIEIIVGDVCWKRVHDDYFSVYDMTYWVSNHPGGPYHM